MLQWINSPRAAVIVPSSAPQLICCSKAKQISLKANTFCLTLVSTEAFLGLAAWCCFIIATCHIALNMNMLTIFPLYFSDCAVRKLPFWLKLYVSQQICMTGKIPDPQNKNCPLWLTTKKEKKKKVVRLVPSLLRFPAVNQNPDVYVNLETVTSSLNVYC